MDVFEVISETLISEMATRQPGVLLAFENTKFAQPVDRTPWCFVAYAPNESTRAELGNSNPVFFHCGVINISVMTASDTGTMRLREIADSLFRILADRNWSLGADGSATTYGVKVRNRGFLNGEYVFSVQCEYRTQAQLVR